MPTVAGARLRWYERTALRYFDGETNPDFTGEDDPDYDPFDVAVRIGIGFDDDSGSPLLFVRMTVSYVTAASTIRLDVEVRFRLAAGSPSPEPRGEFVRRHAVAYTLGYARAGFTDACRSVGLKGLMIPMLNLDDALETEDVER